jgi:hypothetical protein
VLLTEDGLGIFLWGPKQGHRMFIGCALQEAHAAIKAPQFVGVFGVLAANCPEVCGLTTLQACEVLVEQDCCSIVGSVGHGRIWPEDDTTR